MKKDSDKIFIPHYGAVDKRIAESYIQAMMKYTKLYCDIKQTSLDIYSAFCWPDKDKKRSNLSLNAWTHPDRSYRMSWFVRHCC